MHTQKSIIACTIFTLCFINVFGLTKSGHLVGYTRLQPPKDGNPWTGF